MSKYNKPINKIFEMLNGLIYRVSNKEDFFVELEIVSKVYNKNIIKLSENNKWKININKNIIVNDKLYIPLDDIIKIKILNTNLSEEIKDILMEEIKDIVKKEPIQQNRSKNLNHNKRHSNTVKYKNIESLIRSSDSGIKTVTFYGTKEDCAQCIENIDDVNVLNDTTSLVIKKESVLGNTELSTERSSVLASIKEVKEEVIKDIQVEEKLVLTDKSKEIEVAKPIKVEELDIVTDIQVDDLNVLANPQKTKVVKDISEEKSKAIVNLKVNLKNNLIGNIDKPTQLIKPENMDILDISPMNDYINKEDVVNKPLVLDPTGENYIGVVLDDGTFEPLTITMKTITVFPGNIESVLINLNENNIVNQVVEDISFEEGNFLKSLDIEYNENIVEHDIDKVKGINEVIKTSNKKIKNILNEDETTFVIAKENLESIKSLKNTNNTLVSRVDDIKNTNAITFVNCKNTQKDVIKHVSLNKECSNVVEKIESTNKTVLHSNEENIDGVVESVGNGIMLVDNNDFGITIYSTDKIKNINRG